MKPFSLLFLLGALFAVLLLSGCLPGALGQKAFVRDVATKIAKGEINGIELTKKDPRFQMNKIYLEYFDIFYRARNAVITEVLFRKYGRQDGVYVRFLLEDKSGNMSISCFLDIIILSKFHPDGSTTPVYNMSGNVAAASKAVAFRNDR